jgi:hypothetical protein
MAKAARGPDGPLFDREELEQLKPSDSPPRVLDVVSVEQEIQAIQRKAELLRVATVALTIPEDWVRMGDFGYLQNKGCERVSAAWAIEFDRITPGDFVREDLPGGHVAWSAIVSGRCARTGESKSEIGSRSTVGEWYFSRFEAAGPAERTLLIYDCRKAALTNANGRLTRALTGMGGIAIEQLKAYGLNTDRIPEAQFQSGAKGGRLDPNGASEKQLWKIAALACRDRRVADLKPENLDHTIGMLKGCRLTGGRGGTASQIIEWLTAQRTPVPMDDFLARVGFIAPEDPGSAHGSPSAPKAAAAGVAS